MSAPGIHAVVTTLDRQIAQVEQAITGDIDNDPDLRGRPEPVRRRGKPPKLILCHLMRELLHIVWGVIKSRTPFDPGKALAAA